MGRHDRDFLSHWICYWLHSTRKSVHLSTSAWSLLMLSNWYHNFGMICLLPPPALPGVYVYHSRRFPFKICLTSSRIYSIYPNPIVLEWVWYTRKKILKMTGCVSEASVVVAVYGWSGLWDQDLLLDEQQCRNEEWGCSLKKEDQREIRE